MQKKLTSVARTVVALSIALSFGLAIGIAPSTAAQPEQRGDVPAAIGSWARLPIPSPDNPPGMDNEMLEIDCDGLACTGLGLWGPSLDVSYPTVMNMRGGRATVSRIPRVALGTQAGGISCVTQAWCMTVGWVASQTTEADRTWSSLRKNGSWSNKPTPTPTNGQGGQAYLNGVSCTSTTFCLAVGHYFDPLGKTWGLVVRWNGWAWKRILVGKLGGITLNAVDCVASGHCVMVGDAASAVAIRYSAGKLARFSGPDIHSSTFTGVDCVTANWCGLAGRIGASSPLVGFTIGGTWRRLPPGRSNVAMQSMSDISCSAIWRCTVSTAWQDAKGFSHPAIWRMNGNRPKTVPMPRSATMVGSLVAVDCQPQRCVAVGQGYLKSQLLDIRNIGYQGPPN